VLDLVLEGPWLRFTLLVLIALTVQLGLLAEFRVAGATGDVMMLLALVAGLAGGPLRGGVAGFVVGLVFDLVLLSPFGVTALTYCLLGYALGFVPSEFVRGAFWVPPLIVLGASAVGTVLYVAVETVFGQEGIFTAHVVPMAIVVAVINALLAPIAFRATRWALLGGDRQRV
jgi:rod shape-determining protein MreD